MINLQQTGAATELSKMTTASLARKCLFFSFGLSLYLSVSLYSPLYQFAITSIFSHRMQFLPLLCGISASVAMTSLPARRRQYRSSSLALSQLLRGVGSIKRAPSTVILRLLRIATLEMAYAEMDGLPVGSFAWTRFQLQLQQLLLSLLVCPINPIISCKAMRRCWLDFPVRHDIS